MAAGRLSRMLRESVGAGTRSNAGAALSASGFSNASIVAIPHALPRTNRPKRLANQSVPGLMQILRADERRVHHRFILVGRAFERMVGLRETAMRNTFGLLLVLAGVSGFAAAPAVSAKE